MAICARIYDPAEVFEDLEPDHVTWRLVRRGENQVELLLVADQNGRASCSEPLEWLVDERQAQAAKYDDLEPGESAGMTNLRSVVFKQIFFLKEAQ